jgi:plastocyanin
MRTAVQVLVTIALALPAAALGAAADADAAATAEIRIRDFAFGPVYSRVEPGDSVRWLQTGSLHTVTSRAGSAERFDSGPLPTGEQFLRAFPAAGRYPYHCTIHPEMRGVVQVGPDTVAPALTRVEPKLGAKALKLSFRLSEGARVSATIIASSRPRRVLRRAKERQLEDGARSLRMAVAGLDPGRYRVRVRAIDRESNTAAIAKPFRIPAAAG